MPKLPGVNHLDASGRFRRLGSELHGGPSILS